MFQFLSRSRTAIRLALCKLKILLLATGSDSPRKLVRKKTHCKHNMPKNYTEFNFTLRPVKKDPVATPKKSVLFADKVELFEFSQDKRVLSAIIPFKLQIDDYMNGELTEQRRVSIESISSSESDTTETIDCLYMKLMAMRNELLEYYYEPGESHPSQQLPIAISV
ncbi:hypothetical protein IWW40_003256 [Coemansia sp. RSA 1250]|nr:hypothetical protein IWW40_003256 [Coemansia sp. RSA 1250]